LGWASVERGVISLVRYSADELNERLGRRSEVQAVRIRITSLGSSVLLAPATDDNIRLRKVAPGSLQQDIELRRRHCADGDEYDYIRPFIRGLRRSTDGGQSAQRRALH